jgi:hypothetical protein
MKAYEATATIEADAQTVWRILVDGDRYTNWDSGVVKLDGKIALGERLKVVSEANPGRAFPVRVTELDPEHSMRWTGGMPLGLFKGERTFTLTPGGASATQFRVREEYTGPLVGLIWRTIPDLGPSFEKFARGLKQQAEQGG